MKVSLCRVFSDSSGDWMLMSPLLQACIGLS